MKISRANYTVFSGLGVGGSIINQMTMTDEDIASYQAIRASVGLPPIPDKEALVEAQALVNFLMITYR